MMHRKGITVGEVHSYEKPSQITYPAGGGPGGAPYEGAYPGVGAGKPAPPGISGNAGPPEGGGYPSLKPITIKHR
jgi:hypothetical protein